MSTLTPICQKRLIGDLRLLKNDPLEFIDALPDENNLLIWYFIVKGPEFSEFSGRDIIWEKFFIVPNILSNHQIL